MKLDDLSRKELRDFIADVLTPYPKHIVVGPVVWYAPGQYKYSHGFIVSAGEDGGEPHHDQITGDEADLLEEMRAALVTELVPKRPPLVVHLMDDEVAQAKLCAVIWPTEKMKQLRDAVIAEHKTFTP